MNISTSNTRQKILLIRMLSIKDTATIGVAALRHFQDKFPDGQIDFLTFGDGAEIIRLAAPEINVFTLPDNAWPHDLLVSMQAFLGLAEDIIPQEYNQIVNLDTAFMPCFLARFLRDAGEQVVGNILNISIQTLIDKFHDKSLQPEYVQSTDRYMQSTFSGMTRLASRWWEGEYSPDGGFTEFYLRTCCGLNDINIRTNLSISAPAKDKRHKVIGLCLADAHDGYAYPYVSELIFQLEARGFVVWSNTSDRYSLPEILMKVAGSDLVVTKAGESQWYGGAVGCETLLISAGGSPLFVMPDYATDQTARCPVHCPFIEQEQGECCCDAPVELAESINSVFLEQNR